MKRLATLIMMVALLAVSSITPVAAQGQDIATIASGDARFSTLVTALQAAGLVDTLKGTGPFTVFAPTNEAFAKLPPGTLDSLLKDKAALTKVLTYHVVSGNVKAADVVGLTSAKSLQGENIAVKTSGNAVMVNNANVIATDIMASNGVIHVIDTVIMPPSMMTPATTAAAPGTLPTTGGEAGLPWLPMAAVAAGLLMLAGAYVLQPRAR